MKRRLPSPLPLSDHQERGQSLVELALTLTLILTLLAGIFDLGRGFFSSVALRDAAQEGALYGSINPTNTSGIINRVRSASTTPVDLTDTENVDVIISISGAACAGGAITVRVVYDYQLTMPFIGTILGTQTIPITATVTDTILRPGCP